LESGEAEHAPLFAPFGWHLYAFDQLINREIGGLTAEQFIALYKALGNGWEKYRDIPSAPQPLPAIAAMFKHINTAAEHTFDIGTTGPLDARLSVLNLFDRIYEIRDGSGIGVFAPQYGPRRTLFVSLSKAF